MTFRLANPGWRWALFLLCFVVSILEIYTSARVWQADRAASAQNGVQWARATLIEPGYADYWYRLGLYNQLDLENGNPQQAISDFRKATAIDPRSATYWMDLGGAYEAAGEIPAAQGAFETALSVYPASSEVHWRFGNFLLRHGQTARANQEIHTALLIDPTITPLAISVVWRSSQDSGALLNTVLPDTDTALDEALAWFCEAREAAPALAVWRRIRDSGRPFEIKKINPLIDILLGQNLGDDARQVWAEALRASGRASQAETGASLVYNGGFETDSIEGG
ncbi:MAG: tetratricopeptide repeat protein, partial [Bryobacteraceae bacterium]